MPGYDQRELTVTISDHMLTVIGDRKTDTAKGELTARVRERLESRVERRFQLPATVDGDHVQAGAKPHTVPIETK